MLAGWRGRGRGEERPKKIGLGGQADSKPAPAPALADNDSTGLGPTLFGSMTQYEGPDVDETMKTLCVRVVS